MKGEIYTNQEAHERKELEREYQEKNARVEKHKKINIGITAGLLLAVIACIITIGIAISKIQTYKMQNGEEPVMQNADVTINKTTTRNIILTYNGGTYNPERVQFKEGIVFWSIGEKTYCADRHQVSITIISEIDKE